MSEPRRQLAAIMFSDIVGYTAIMQVNELEGKTKALYYRKVLAAQALIFNGTVLQNYGDGSLTIFDSAVHAAACAIAMQKIFNESPQIPLRIGIHLGDIVIDGDDFFGNGINIAGRIESMGVVGNVLISEQIHEQIKNHESFQFTSMGSFDFKNVDHSIEVFAISNDGLAIPNPNELQGKFSESMTLQKSIAVLPFVNMSSDPEQDFFSDGISEEIINTLAQLPNLKVAGRTSSFTFKGKNEDIRIIGEKLGVNTILEGSVRNAGERIRITAQLIDVKTGFHLWSEKYDRILNDVFEVQDDIAKTILEKLQITLVDLSEHSLIREQTQNVQAYQLYLKGRALLYKRDKYLFKSISLFEEALQLDSSYALAYAGLADAHTIICYFGLLPPKEIWPKAIAYAQKAMQYGPNLAETYNCNAEISILYEWNWEKGRQQYIRAIELNPGYEQARGWYALFYLQLAFGRHEEAIEQIRMALEVNPLSFYSNTIMGLSYGIAGQHEKAVESARKGLLLEPNSYITQCYLGCVLHWSGNHEEAEVAFENALTLSGRHSWAIGFLAINYIDWGKKEKALVLYQELLDKSEQKFIHPTFLATVAAALGNVSEASNYLALAFEEHDPLLHIAAKCFPDTKALRDLPGYAELVRKMGLEII